MLVSHGMFKMLQAIVGNCKPHTYKKHMYLDYKCSNISKFNQEVNCFSCIKHQLPVLLSNQQKITASESIFVLCIKRQESVLIISGPDLLDNIKQLVTQETESLTSRAEQVVELIDRAYRWEGIGTQYVRRRNSKRTNIVIYYWKSTIFHTKTNTNVLSR